MKITEDKWNWAMLSTPSFLTVTNGYDTAKVICDRNKANAEKIHYTVTINDGSALEGSIQVASGQERTAIFAFLKRMLEEPRETPMTLIEMLEQIALERSEGYIHGIVGVDLNEIVKNDIDEFDDIISERLTGTEKLVDMGWNVVGFNGNTLFLRISGDARELLCGNGTAGDVWNALINALGKCEAENKRGYWTNGEEILCKTEKEANDLADFLEKSLGFESVNTSYYDPQEDERDGSADENTGYWAIY